MSCDSGFFCVDVRVRYMYIVPREYMRILGAASVQPYCTLAVYVSYRVVVYDRDRKSRLVCV